MMLAHIVNNSNRASYSDALAQMFQHRHQVFVETKQWRDLRTVEGVEIDDFDTPDSTYILVINDVGGLEGSLRLRPSCRPHMLQALAATWGIAEIPVEFGTWEWSRYMPARPGASYGAIRESRAVLITAALEFAISRRIHCYTAICDLKRFNMFSELGWEMEFLSPLVDYGQGKAAAIKWRVERSHLEFARAHFGLKRAVTFELPPIPDAASLTHLHHALLSEFWGLADADSLTAALDAATRAAALREVANRGKATARCGTVADLEFKGA